jgi:hypothetical protein
MATHGRMTFVPVPSFGSNMRCGNYHIGVLATLARAWVNAHASWRARGPGEMSDYLAHVNAELDQVAPRQ